MNAVDAILRPGHMQPAVREVHLLPSQGAKLRRTQPVPESQQNHGRVPVPIAVVTGCLHEPLDFLLREVFTAAVMRVGAATSANCSLLGVGATLLAAAFIGEFP